LQGTQDVVNKVQSHERSGGRWPRGKRKGKLVRAMRGERRYLGNREEGRGGIECALVVPDVDVKYGGESKLVGENGIGLAQDFWLRSLCGLSRALTLRRRKENKKGVILSLWQNKVEEGQGN